MRPAYFPMPFPPCMLAAPMRLFVTFESNVACVVANTSASIRPSLYHCAIVVRNSRNSGWSGPYLIVPFSWYHS